MTSHALLARLRELCVEGWPDVIVAEENASGGELRDLRGGAPRVWVKHSVGVIDAQQMPAGSATARFHRWVDVGLVARHESSVIDECELVVALTQEDAAELDELYSPRALAVVPNGVRIPDLPSSRPIQASVGFVGDYSWGANIDAARWFAAEIWPSVRAAVPEATFSLIGKNLDVRGMRDVAGPGIRRVGYAADLGGALGSIQVGVVPMRSGTGIRCKLLDLLAAGVPTVTTRLGLRGVPAREGFECLVADAAPEFARHVVTLLRDREAHGRIAGAARQLAETLTWKSRADELQEHFERVAGQ
jgi:glycosyltransferase involved in cell wall biosynthesis